MERGAQQGAEWSVEKDVRWDVGRGVAALCAYRSNRTLRASYLCVSVCARSAKMVRLETDCGSVNVS